MVVIHRDKLRWLFWLRWKMLMRSFVRDRGRIIFTIIQLVLFLPLFGLVAVGTFFGYRFLPAPANTELLFLVLTAIYVLWIFFPIMQFNTNEGLDISKLLPFPLTRWEIMASLLFSTLFDIFTIGLLMILVVVVIGWAVSIPVALMSAVAMIVFYVNVVGISQFVLALLTRVLQSRRFRDLSYVLIVLLASSCYLLQQIVLNGIGTSHVLQNLQQAPFSPYLQWLPPGMAARSVQMAVQGNWLASFGWLGLSLVIGFIVLYLWQLVIERSLSAPETGGGGSRRRSRRPAPELGFVAESAATIEGQPARVGVVRGLFASQVWAITLKELKYFRRDPQIQAILLQSVIYMVVIIVLPLLNLRNNPVQSASSLLFIAPLVVFLYMFTLALNTLGMDRESLTTLFLFPIQPQRILFGKNLSVFLIGIVEMLLLVLVGAFLTKTPGLVIPVLAAGLAGMGVVLGCGNITSVFFPQRMRQMRGFRATGSSTNTADGCTRGLLSIVMMVVTLILLVPVGLALGLPVIFGVQWVWIVTVPLALVYGIAFHQVVTRLVAPRIVSRTPEILAATTRE